MESSFHQNVFLLTQAVPPSKDFLKHFKEGMFDKPNTVGFLHVSHYLLTIIDPERFKKLIQWPVFCKKTEAKYRTGVKDLLSAVASENRDVDFPPILASHLLHASGSKFSTIMWKLSTVALRTYIKRETRANLIAPKSGVAENLARKMLNNEIKQSAITIENIDTAMMKMEQEVQTHAKQMADSIEKNQQDLFFTRQNLLKLATDAPVHPEIKKRLADPNDTEVIEMWKSSFDKNLNYLKIKQAKLKEIAELSEQIAAMVANIAGTDSIILDGSRLPNIATDLLSEIGGSSPEAQVIFHRLYANESLVLENFLLLLNLFLSNLRRKLKKDGFPDLSGCDWQVEASLEDMNSLSDLFHALHERIVHLSAAVGKKEEEEEEDGEDGRESSQSYPHHMDKDLFDSVLLKSSPTIRINGNVEGERGGDVNEKRLELTPVENTHNKLLFSRYKRNKTPQTHTKLRPKLLVSRINFEDTVSRCSSLTERMSPAGRGAISKFANLSSNNRSGKYSRLFTSYQKKPSSGFNSTVLNPERGLSRVNADMNNTSCDVYNISELLPHITTTTTTTTTKTKTSKFENRGMFTPQKRIAERASSTMYEEEVVQIKITRPETSEFSIAAARSPKIFQSDKKQQNDAKNRRVSISDLVERYRKLADKSSDGTAHFETSSEASDESAKH